MLKKSTPCHQTTDPDRPGHNRHVATRPLERFASALPDAITAGYFLTLWLAPLAFGDHGVRNGMLIMLVEFIVIHSSGFLGAVAFGDIVSRSAKVKTLCGFAVVYLLFIAAWSYSFQAWWPFVAFGWLWIGKAVVALDKRLPTQERMMRMMSGWALSVVFYLGGAFMTVFLPIPKLGFSGIDMTRLDLPGSGEWIDNPHTVMAFGVVYFSLPAISKWRDWVLPASQFRFRRTLSRQSSGQQEP